MLTLTTFFLSSCGRGQGSRKSTEAPQQDAPVHAIFKVPRIPDIISDETDRIEYLVSNWWTGWSPQMDSLEAEKAFAQWTVLALELPLGTASASLVEGLGRDSLRILSLAQKYLYDPNSPYRDEDIYGRLAAHCGGDLAAEARLCAMNRRGSVAADFVYEDARGRRHTLHGTEAPFTVLFFSNPGCTACKEIIDAMGSDPKAAWAVEVGLVAVVNIYIDEDLEAWREYLPNYPAKWICGFDPLFTLRDDNKYHIRAIPSVYLLDSEKKVILKDAPTPRLLNTLNQML